MNAWVGRLPGGLVTAADNLDREFEERLADSSSLAFRVAYGVLRNRADAEDVAQEAFAKAHRSFRQLRDRERFRGWLVRMTWRLALDHRKSARRRGVRELAAIRDDHVPSAEHALLADERARRLWAAIDALPEKLRVVTVLAAIEEHSLEEVARLLDLPLGTVKSRSFAARQKLEALLSCDPMTR